jgi:hypothetical protein
MEGVNLAKIYCEHIYKCIPLYNNYMLIIFFNLLIFLEGIRGPHQSIQRCWKRRKPKRICYTIICSFLSTVFVFTQSHLESCPSHSLYKTYRPEKSSWLWLSAKTLEGDAWFKTCLCCLFVECENVSLSVLTYKMAVAPSSQGCFEFSTPLDA